MMGFAQRALDLPRRGTLAVSGLVLAVFAVLAVTSLPGTATPLPALAGLALFVAVGAWTAVAPGQRLGLLPALVAGITPTILVLVVSWAVIRAGHAFWHLGASAFLLLLVALRGRLGIAWAGMGLMSATTLAWGASSVFGVETISMTLARQVAILVIGTVLVIAIGRVQGRLAELSRATSRLAADGAAASAAEIERRGRLRWARRLAAGLLEAIATRERLEPELRLEAALVEAELRDGLRARSLAAEPVSSLARAARARGVEVVLLDDRTGELPDELAARLRERIAGELEATAEGRIVVRLPPEGRGPLATVLVDGAERSRLELGERDLA